MKIRVQKDLLQKKLSNIQGIIDKGSSQFILNHFLFHASKEWSFIMATDLETAYREPIDLYVEEEGKLCIPAKRFYDFVRELEGIISLEDIDGNWLKISCDRTNVRLACLSHEDYPIWPTLEGEIEISLSSADLIKLIERTLYAVRDIDSRLFLKGLLFRVSGDNILTVVGTDTHRLAVARGYVSRDKGDIEGVVDVLLSRKSIVELEKALSAEADKVSITIGKNHVCFKIRDIDFLIRRVEGNFPNYEQVIPSSFDKVVVLSRADFIRSLRKVSIMSKEKGCAVRIKLEEGSMLISSNEPDLWEAYDEMDVDYAGEPFLIAFNAKYLLDALYVMSSDRAVLKLIGPESASMLHEEGNEDYKCLVMPLRF